MLITQEDGTKLAINPKTIVSVPLNPCYTQALGGPPSRHPQSEPSWSVDICAQGLSPSLDSLQAGHHYSLLYEDRAEADKCFDRVVKASGIDISED